MQKRKIKRRERLPKEPTQLSEKIEIELQKEVETEENRIKSIVCLLCSSCKRVISCGKETPIYICCQTCGCLFLEAQEMLEYECLSCGKKGKMDKGETVLCSCKKKTMILR